MLVVYPLLALRAQQIQWGTGFRRLFLAAKYLIKTHIVYFFLSMSTTLNTSVIHVIQHMITKLTGDQFYYGLNFLNDLEIL